MERVVRLATAGSVDDGKSTLIGRLLVLTDSLYDDQLAEIDAASARHGRTGRDVAFVTDGLREERERNITIDAAYRPFRTSRRRFLLADAPGHAEYTRNMVTAGSTADLLIVLVDVTRDLAVQTRRHLAVAAFLRTPVVLAVNKMDLIGFDGASFERWASRLTQLGERLGCPSIQAVPISAFLGDNVIEPSASMPWYEGPTLLELLEEFSLPSVEESSACLPVQTVGTEGEGKIAAGTLLGASIKVGDALGAARIERLWVAGDERTKAAPGQPIAVLLSGAEGVRRGDLLGATSDAGVARFTTTLFWMLPDPLRIDMSYRLRQGPRTMDATIRRVRGVVDLETGQRSPAESVTLNDLAEVEIELDEAVPLRLFGENRELGSFVLIDPRGYTVAAGTIDRVLPARPAAPAGPKVFWLTGLSGAGKSSVAEAAVVKLSKAGIDAVHLDGDSLRAGLCSDLGFSPEDRMENIRRVAEVAKLMIAQGRPTICSLISPLRSHREQAKRILGDAFVEVFVRCELDECVRRDPKGLYARALAGAIPRFTGIGAPYEPPESPDLILDTQASDLAACVDLLANHLLEGVAA